MGEIKTRISKYEDALSNAMLNADLEKLDELIHDQLLFTVPTGDLITKEMDLGAYRSGMMKLTAIEKREMEAREIDDTILVSVIVEMKGSFNNQPMDGTYRFLRVWKKTDSGYQIIAGSSTPV